MKKIDFVKANNSTRKDPNLKVNPYPSKSPTAKRNLDQDKNGLWWIWKIYNWYTWRFSAIMEKKDWYYTLFNLFTTCMQYGQRVESGHFFNFDQTLPLSLIPLDVCIWRMVPYTGFDPWYYYEKGNSEHVAHAWRKIPGFFMWLLVTALNLDKCFKQINEQKFPLTCAPNSELPTNISTMVGPDIVFFGPV